jgi:hypothetical protein
MPSELNAPSHRLKAMHRAQHVFRAGYISQKHYKELSVHSECTAAPSRSFTDLSAPFELNARSQIISKTPMYLNAPSLFMEGAQHFLLFTQCCHSKPLHRARGSLYVPP